jgi:hypothetical protein
MSRGFEQELDKAAGKHKALLTECGIAATYITDVAVALEQAGYADKVRK